MITHKKTTVNKKKSYKFARIHIANLSMDHQKVMEWENWSNTNTELIQRENSQTTANIKNLIWSATDDHVNSTFHPLQNGKMSFRVTSM